MGPHSDPPPYSIEPEVHNNATSSETTDNIVDETKKTTTGPFTSVRNKLEQKLERFKSNGENSGFHRF